MWNWMKLAQRSRWKCGKETDGEAATLLSGTDNYLQIMLILKETTNRTWLITRVATESSAFRGDVSVVHTSAPWSSVDVFKCLSCELRGRLWQHSSFLEPSGVSLNKWAATAVQEASNGAITPRVHLDIALLTRCCSCSGCCASSARTLCS